MPGRNREAFASFLGFSASTLGNWERGEGKPDTVSLGQIAAGTGASLEWLVFGTGPMMASGNDESINMAAIAERVRSLSDGEPAAGFGLRCGLSEETIDRILQHGSYHVAELSQIAKANAVLIDWLIHGEATIPTDDGCERPSIDDAAQAVADIATAELEHVSKLDLDMPAQDLGKIIGLRFRAWLRARMNK